MSYNVTGGGAYAGTASVINSFGSPFIVQDELNNKVTKGGDADGGALIIGTNDDQDVLLRRDGTNQVQITTDNVNVAGNIAATESVTANSVNAGTITSTGDILLDTYFAATKGRVVWDSSTGRDTYISSILDGTVSVVCNDQLSLFASSTAVTFEKNARLNLDIIGDTSGGYLLGRFGWTSNNLSTPISTYVSSPADGVVTISCNNNRALRVEPTSVSTPGSFTSQTVTTNDITSNGNVLLPTSSGATSGKLVWDYPTGSRDTFLFSPADGSIATFNNGNYTMEVRSDVLLHKGIHNPPNRQAWGSDLSCIESRSTDTVLTEVRIYNLGDPDTVYLDTFNMYVMYTRIGNIVRGTAMTNWTIPAGRTYDGFRIQFTPYYQKHDPVGQEQTIAGVVPTASIVRFNYAGTFSVSDDDPGSSSTVSMGRIRMTRSLGTTTLSAAAYRPGGAWPNGNIVTLHLDFTYEINLT